MIVLQAAAPLLLLISCLCTLGGRTEAFVATTQRRSGESRSETLAPSRLELAASNEYDSDDHFEAQVAGVSVSGSGFLVLLQTSNAEATTTFPIQLTETSTIEEVTNSTENRLPSLFQDNNDQSSVNTAEALTFLQLLNGVDMATMVLPPDMLSLISVWYAFLIDEYSVEVEDELGLSDETNVSQDSGDALEYIRTMVRTTMPTTEIGSTLSYIDASAWQRARVQLPRVWLRGVKLDVVEPQIMSSDDGRRVRTVPIKFTLECSVDDGSKFLEIPLISVPRNAAVPSHHHAKIDLSNDILTEVSQNFNAASSAAFTSLALLHRYTKSGEASLMASSNLISKLTELEKRGSRYCWITNSAEGKHNEPEITNAINDLIRSSDLPYYRSLSQVKEEDQRVMQHLSEQNFGKSSSSSSKSDELRNQGGRTEIKSEKRKPLTIEQQATQQRLKSAWKIAVERDDKLAIEKILSAMRDLERELEDDADENDSPEESSLERIKKAMQMSEDQVGLIADLRCGHDGCGF